MAIVTIQNFIICSLVSSASAEPRFLAKNSQVPTDAIQNELMGVLSDVLGHGHGVTEDRLKQINATLQPIFRSLPKNSRGHVSEPIMRYTVSRYFRAAHGWIVNGFEDHGDHMLNATNSSNIDILQSKVPEFVRTALEQKFAHQGFSLDDMLSMIAVLESLSFNEVVRAVELSFRMNSFGLGAILSEAELWNVVASFHLVEMFDGSTDLEVHRAELKNPFEFYPNWGTIVTFLTDIVGSDGYGRHSTSNPFTLKTFAFEDVVRMAVRITEEFGTYSNWECQGMRDTLSQRDVHQTGRVKLADFYKSEGMYSFIESSDYLRQLGALDESSEYHGPQVIISNYVSSMSNCIRSSMYFSVCCLNDCDLTYQHIENKIPYPKGTVAQILAAVESLPAYPVISQHLINKLEEIATINGGSIPLHGRLFAQWLHFVLPHECPYPHEAGTTSPNAPVQNIDYLAPESAPQRVSAEEKMQHIQHATASRHPSPDAGMAMWTSQEVIMDFSTPSDTVSDHTVFSTVLRMSSQIVMIVSFASLIVREGMKTFCICKGDEKLKEYTV